MRNLNKYRKKERVSYEKIILYDPHYFEDSSVQPLTAWVDRFDILKNGVTFSYAKPIKAKVLWNAVYEFWSGVHLATNTDVNDLYSRCYLLIYQYNVKTIG